LEPTGWQETATGSVPSAALSIEERLAFINAAMTVRLEEVGIAYEVNTAHIDTEPVDLADVVPVIFFAVLQRGRWPPGPA
jgi:hypothetical protein